MVIQKYLLENVFKQDGNLQRTFLISIVCSITFVSEQISHETYKMN